MEEWGYPEGGWPSQLGLKCGWVGAGGGFWVWWLLRERFLRDLKRGALPRSTED